jgi:glycosyltransferase involved in cell wall biosynthesis
VSVIIPTHNEAEAIRRVLADIPSELVTEVIVVDSNSTDGTPRIAAAMGAHVLQEPRRGYGRACLTGLAETDSPDVIVFLDGDYSDRPAELPQATDGQSAAERALENQLRAKFGFVGTPVRWVQRLRKKNERDSRGSDEE